jgi:hypothetical protein
MQADGELKLKKMEYVVGHISEMKDDDRKIMIFPHLVLHAKLCSSIRSDGRTNGSCFHNFVCVYEWN